MTKSDIVDIIAEGTGLTKLETQAVIDGFLATASFGLKKNERIDLRGFGNFKVVKRNARTARNPKTNEPVHVPEHFTVVFRPSKDLKRYINKHNGRETKD
jgi:nucleoid DNA-binding protein